MADTQLSAPVASAALAQIQASALEMRAPFAEPIVIVGSTRVAGTALHPDIDDLCADLAVGARLELRRDAADREDPWKIFVMAPSSKRLGYVASDVNEPLARLMDAGKHVYAVVDRVEVVHSWHKVWIAVYLDD